MPQETKAHGQERTHESIEGKSFEPKTVEQVAEAVDIAFDYRGDATIRTKDGQTIEGYVFNREAHVAEPFLQLFAKGQSGQVRIRYCDIAAISLSGEDIAFGKSWDAWSKKNADQREAEAARAAQTAAALGHL